jgi:SAM-dependent methyltransferase
MQALESRLVGRAECLVCGAGEGEPVLDLAAVPVLSTELHRSADAALKAARGDLQLVYCRRCTAITNRAFRTTDVEYGQAYENSQMFSPRFRAYVEDLCRHLADRYDLAGRHVVEVGSGKGEFLTLLCALAGSRGTGFDPTYFPDGGGAGDDGGEGPPVVFVPEMFDEHSLVDPPDLVCFRHVLEHLDDPVGVLQMIGRGMGDRSALYVEVPNAAFTFTDTGLWDLIYQHCSYFTGGALEHALHAAGFQVVELRSVFDDQFLAAEAVPRTVDDDSVTEHRGDAGREVEGDALAAGARFAQLIEGWRTDLAAKQRAGERVALWGAGAKGVTYLNLVAPADAGATHPVSHVVDVNVRKHGYHLPGTGHRVEAPASLIDARPDLVIVTNPVYASEISAELAGLGVQTGIETL